MMIVLQILLGIVLLVVGRKLFWVLAGVMGFIAAATWASAFFQDLSDVTLILIAVLAGVAGAVIATTVQWLGVALTGFLGGGYLATTLLVILGFTVGRTDWLVYVIGGIIGAIVFISLFNWALIILSALGGATILVQALGITRPMSLIVIVVMAVIGLVVQTRIFKEEKGEGREEDT